MLTGGISAIETMVLKVKGLEREEMIRGEIRGTQHWSLRETISLTRHRKQTARGDQKGQRAAGESSKGQELWELLEQQWKKTKASQRPSSVNNPKALGLGAGTRNWSCAASWGGCMSIITIRSERGKYCFRGKSLRLGPEANTHPRF